MSKTTANASASETPARAVPPMKARKDDSVYVVALMSAIDSLRNLPPAPAFPAEEVEKAFGTLVSLGLVTEANKETFLKNKRGEWEAKHGDQTSQAIKIVFDSLADVESIGEDGLRDALKAILAKPRKERVELTKEQIETMRAERAKGVQPTALVEKYKVSISTVMNKCAGVVVASKTTPATEGAKQDDAKE